MKWFDELKVDSLKVKRLIDNVRLKGIYAGELF